MEGPFGSLVGGKSGSYGEEKDVESSRVWKTFVSVDRSWANHRACLETPEFPSSNSFFQPKLLPTSRWKNGECKCENIKELLFVPDVRHGKEPELGVGSFKRKSKSSIPLIILLSLLAFFSPRFPMCSINSSIRLGR